MRLIVALLALALSAGAYAQRNGQFDPEYKPRDASPEATERDRELAKEGALVLPPYPDPEKLLQFEVKPSGSFSFYIDPESISSGADGIVRYTLVVRSRSGSVNVSYDGLRCRTNEHRVFATGRNSNQSWLVVPDSRWKVQELGASGRQNLVLMRDFFCPAGIAISSRKEGADALRAGGHPLAVGNIHQFAPQ